MLMAFISDIHGNLPALKAAVADAKTKGATAIICAGDITGYGPFPSEVCAYLEENRIASISGNYDCKVLDVIKNGESAVAALQKKKRKLVIWTADHVGKTAQRFLEGLPERINQELPAGRKVLIVHGSPLANDDDIYPSITAIGLEAKIDGVRPDILICGHTHIPFVKRVGGILLINCGSTGQPVDGDPNPSYALVAADDQSAHARIIRFRYDVDETVAAIRKTSMPKGLQKDFVEGTKRRFLQ
jgi:putative phosphoesterase